MVILNASEILIMKEVKIELSSRCGKNVQTVNKIVNNKLFFVFLHILRDLCG
jgi:hypothetical protein